MSETPASTSGTGGLPDAPDLAAAFAAMPVTRPRRGRINTAEATPAGEREPDPAPAEEPAPAGQEPAPDPAGEPRAELPVARRGPAPDRRPVVRPRHRPVRAPAKQNEEQTYTLPDLGAAGSLATQCSVMVTTDVRERVREYQQKRLADTGREPTNALVVRRAVAAAYKGRDEVMPELLDRIRREQHDAEDEDDDPDGLFGDVDGRRVARGRVKGDRVQQPFRPSRQELATIDALTHAYGFPSRSDFVNVVLGWWLPPRKRSGGR